MMEVVIVDDGNRLTVYELVERVIPCIIAKHYSENYIQGFRSTFRNLLAYCNKNEKKYFTAELAQQFRSGEISVVNYLHRVLHFFSFAPFLLIHRQKEQINLPTRK